MSDCLHASFKAEVDCNRFEDTGRFSADIRIACADCGLPFHFVGVESGVSWVSPRAEVDGTELRAPIAPGPRMMEGSGEIHVPPEVSEIARLRRRVADMERKLKEWAEAGTCWTGAHKEFVRGLLGGGEL